MTLAEKAKYRAARRGPCPCHHCGGGGSGGGGEVREDRDGEGWGFCGVRSMRGAGEAGTILALVAGIALGRRTGGLGGMSLY